MGDRRQNAPESDDEVLSDLPLGESCCRATQVLAFRSAAFALYGQLGWSEILGLLPPDVRSRIEGAVLPVGWVPERDLMALAEAVLAGPAQHLECSYVTFVHRVIDHGFGRIRRFMVALAAPAAFLKRAPALWRHDHTHGHLEIEIDDRAAKVLLVDHVHTTTPLSRLTAAEMFRYILASTRARNVRATHSLAGPSLEVRLTWE